MIFNRPQVKTPTTATLHGISDGPQGTLETLKLMRRLVLAGKTSLPVRLTALSCVKNLLQKDYVSEVRCIQRYVRDEIRYVKDIVDIETLQTPDKTLEIGQGDCDDKSILVSAMLETIGHPSRFLAIGFSAGNFSHVLVETKIGNRWVTVETTEPVDIGWLPRGIKEKMLVHI